MNKILFVISILSIMGSCSASAAPSWQNTMDIALSDALAQISSVDDMTIYKSERSDKNNNLEFIESQVLYLSDNTYKTVISALYNGSLEFNSQPLQFNHEIIGKIAEEGTSTKTTSFTLLNSDNEPITDKRGYDTLYTLTQSSSKYWYSSKLGDRGTWVTEPKNRLEKQYFIIKESAKKLSMIYVSKSGDNYILRTPNLSEAIQNSLNFTKQ